MNSNLKSDLLSFIGNAQTVKEWDLVGEILVDAVELAYARCDREDVRTCLKEFLMEVMSQSPPVAKPEPAPKPIGVASLVATEVARVAVAGKQVAQPASEPVEALRPVPKSVASIISEPRDDGKPRKRRRNVTKDLTPESRHAG